MEFLILGPTVILLRYGAGVINLTESELKVLDQKTRKKMTLYDAFHSKSDVGRFYVGRDKGGRVRKE